MNDLFKIFKGILGLAIAWYFFHYVFIFFIIWGLIEIIIRAIKTRYFIIVRIFICNFVITILECIDILANIVLQIPANRILLTTSQNPKYPFGNPKESFTEILSMNFLYQNLTNRGVVLYKILKRIKK